MSADRGRRSIKGRAVKYLLVAALAAAATKASSHPTPRKAAKKAVELGRAWSNAATEQSPPSSGHQVAG